MEVKNTGRTTGESKRVELKLFPRSLACVDEKGIIKIEPGKLKFYVGDVCPSAPERFRSKLVSGELELKGETVYYPLLRDLQHIRHEVCTVQENENL